MLGFYIIPSHVIFPIIQLFPFIDKVTEANLTRALVADSEAHSFLCRTLPTYIYTGVLFPLLQKGSLSNTSYERKGKGNKLL